jgi:hypothetical protein
VSVVQFLFAVVMIIGVTLATGLAVALGLLVMTRLEITSGPGPAAPQH